ncbi:hypothetical protein CDD80_3364 [Ophiocordyceps camponoti-rufipedis]|uniref:DNA2/NAM7 helicase-like C-terminal domain-containing protein n=1 Tax=Ophiocordyceps camponoti-rufipedis TaxID=2004952 RepID=A0A2C5ZMR2_9HYPO|nr:hypothetical protein CDD80_3364 [Ophiocordyceps camponoti-rufipedis]
MLQPFFLHVEGSFCIVDPVTKSQKNPDQVRAALNLLAELVSRDGVKAAIIAIISPYKANCKAVFYSGPTHVAVNSLSNRLEGVLSRSPGQKVAVFIVALLHRFGHVFCSAPTHVACDNLAGRLMRILVSVMQRHSASVPKSRMLLIPLVVRPYAEKEELESLVALLKDPQAVQERKANEINKWQLTISLAFPCGRQQHERSPGRSSAVDPRAIQERKFNEIKIWQPNLSLAFWFLVAFESDKVADTCPESSVPAGIRTMREAIKTIPDIASLRALVAGTLSWEDYNRDKTVQDNAFKTVFKLILQIATAAALIYHEAPEAIRERSPSDDAWVNGNAPIAGPYTLLDLTIKQRLSWTLH